MYTFEFVSGLRFEGINLGSISASKKNVRTFSGKNQIPCSCMATTEKFYLSNMMFEFSLAIFFTSSCNFCYFFVMNTTFMLFMITIFYQFRYWRNRFCLVVGIAYQFFCEREVKVKINQNSTKVRLWFWEDFEKKSEFELT